MNIYDLMQSYNLSTLKNIAEYPEPFHVEQFGIDTLNDLKDILFSLDIINKIGGYSSAININKSIEAIYPGFDFEKMQFVEIEFVTESDSITAQNIKNALLNYRRYFGIYEKGDLIFYNETLGEYPPPLEITSFRHAAKTDIKLS